MPSNQPARLTKKQKKATAFRDRSRKGKGKVSHLTPRHSQRQLSTTGDNGDDDDDAFNAVPAMEDEALAEVASAAEGDKDPKVAVGTRTTKEKKEKKRRRDGDGDAGSSAPPPAKKARLARRSDAAPVVARGEDAAASIRMNQKDDDDDDDDGHEPEKRTNKGSKERYILFIGAFRLPPHFRLFHY
jgi:hypothetical protein